MPSRKVVWESPKPKFVAEAKRTNGWAPVSEVQYTDYGAAVARAQKALEMFDETRVVEVNDA